MRKYFIVGLAAILLLSVGTIYYGAWLNRQGEFQIVRRVEESRLEVPCSKVAVRKIYPQIHLSAVQLYSESMADAVALIDGTVTKILANKNSCVHQGDAIFTIENENIPLQIKETEADILKATSEYKRTENNYRRYEKLREDDAVSAVQFDEAQAAFVAAKANLEAAQARHAQLLVQDSRKFVTAPIDGKILVLYRRQGAYVQAGTSLALVGDFSTLYFSVPVEDKYAQHLGVGQGRVYQYDAERYQQTAREDIYSDYDGIVDEVMVEEGNIVSAGTPICTVRLTQNRTDLRGIFYIPVDKGKRVEPGSYCTGSIVIDRQPPIEKAFYKISQWLRSR